MMSRKSYLVCLLAAALLLSGCGAKAPEDKATGDAAIIEQVPALQLPSTAPLPEGIDPSAEEDTDAEYVDQSLGMAALANVTDAPSQIYAGATPIPLDPIDLPTPTKAPPLTFTYASYTANALGLTFDSVAGYSIDESDSGTYILTEPAESVKDNYPVTITLSMRPVMNTYKATDIPTDLKQMLADLGSVNYKTWQPSGNASRPLMNAKGYFANYRGILTDGTIVRGRVHMALLPGSRLLTLHISNPANFNTDYDNVYSQIRKTLRML